MGYNLYLTPKAQHELLAAKRFYWEISPAIAARFVEEVSDIFDEIAENPFRFPEIEIHIRRAVFTRKFPYTILYSLSKESVKILAISHQRKHPNHLVS